MNTLSAFGRYNERGGGGVLSTFGRFNERGRRGAIRFRPIQSVRCPPSRPIQSFNQWAEGAELLLQGGGGGEGGGGRGGGAIQSRRGHSVVGGDAQGIDCLLSPIIISLNC